ncbi:MAG: class I SAM-dependent methyltransferase [Solirubrobacteraceae bacterium]
MPKSYSAAHTSLPARYEPAWGAEFWEYVEQALKPGAVVLDVGSGRRPTIAAAERPPDCHYVGLDVVASELEISAAGSYNETVVADVQKLTPGLCGRFDLIVAWQVLEHVKDMSSTAAVLHEYARDGGWFITTLSGRYAAYALANRLLPARVGGRLVARLRDRPIETVFQAHYDRCTAEGLRTAFSCWEELRVVPLWHAADYFDRFPRLQRLYLGYENLVSERGFEGLATNYVIAARKGVSPI